ncbi:membrane protein insertase YidC [Cellulomonas sp. HZM]|uniref:membrane protein insertase YidC n=1 Tax=Cellulomonas sp. HZM TaxID=1454010 RepID=UPI0004935822|nr:membrane protein insertase YidC [Cellulomonas sp. HZM]
MGWFDSLLHPIMVVVAWIMVMWHKLWTGVGLDPDGGLAWTLSIVGLVVVIRILLIPLFFKQIKASRGMQMLAPEMKEIQKKYKGKTDPASREAMSRETMELYRKHGTNPFASCLPILLQSPIFFALFRVLNSLPQLSEGVYRGNQNHIGPLTQDLAYSAEHATIFGAPLSGTFMRADGNHNIQIVAALLIIAMSATTFLTQRQLTMKNMPPSALEGPMAQQQKVLLYVLPLIFAFSGVNFPIGVLIYWTTTNLWSMGQQFYTIRRMPAPGSAAEKAMLERKARRSSHRGGGALEPAASTAVIEEKPRSGQRQQPKRKDRAKGPAGSPPRAVPGADSPAPDPAAPDALEADPAGSADAASGTTTGKASKANPLAEQPRAPKSSSPQSGAKPKPKPKKKK